MLRALVPLLVLSTLLATTTEAQRRRGGRGRPSQPSEETAEAGETGPAPTLDDLDEIVPKLSSENPDDVREAIDLLSVIDHPRVVDPLSDLLRSGQPDAITDRAIAALGGLGHASAIRVLTEFTHHRRVGARRRAYEALAAIDDRRVNEVIARGLSDSDRSVRSACALALGNIGARQELDTLFRAFERGVVEAAISIGKLGSAESVARYTEHLGRQPLAIMLSGYDKFLRRTDIPIAAKEQIVTRLGEVASPMVKRFLQDYLTTFSESDRTEFVRNLRETVRRIRGEPDGAQPQPQTPAPAAAAPAPAAAGSRP